MSKARIGSALIVAVVLGAGLFVTQTRAATLTPLTISQSLSTSGEPWGVAIDPAGTRAFVTDAKANTLFVFDLSTAKPIAFVPTGGQPGSIVLVGSRAYVSNFADSTLTEIDTQTNRGVRTLAVGGLGLAADPSASRLYVASSSTIVVLDTTSDTRVATIKAPSGASVWGLAIDAKARRLYAADAASPRVLVFDTATNALVAQVATKAPARFAIAAGGGRAIVAGYTDQNPQLELIDAATNTVISRGPSAPYATSVAVDAAGNAYVASRTDRTITQSSSALISLSRATLDYGHLPGAVATHPISGALIAVTAGGGAPPARLFGEQLPVVKP